MNKKKVSLLVVAGIAGGVVLLCVGCLAFGNWYGGTPEYKTAVAEDAKKTAVAAAWTATPVPTQTNTLEPTQTPAPTLTPVPLSGEAGNYPTPQPDLYAEIVKQHRSMTDLQFEEYRKGLIGQRIHLQGKVIEVYSDGRVQLSLTGDGFLDTLIVKGFPKKVAITLNKDAVVLLDATIVSVELFIGALQTTVHDPVIWWVK